MAGSAQSQASFPWGVLQCGVENSSPALQIGHLPSEATQKAASGFFFFGSAAERVGKLNVRDRSFGAGVISSLSYRWGLSSRGGSLPIINLHIYTNMCNVI